jgi:hypothetical protein
MRSIFVGRELPFQQTLNNYYIKIFLLSLKITFNGELGYPAGPSFAFRQINGEVA